MNEVKKLAARILALETELAEKYPDDLSMQHAGQSGGFRSMAMHLAERLDAEIKDRKLDSEPPECRTLERIQINFNGSCLHVDGQFDIDYFAINTVWDGSTEVAQYMGRKQLEEVEKLAIEAYKERQSELSAAAKFDRRAA